MSDKLIYNGNFQFLEMPSSLKQVFDQFYIVDLKMLLYFFAALHRTEILVRGMIERGESLTGQEQFEVSLRVLAQRSEDESIVAWVKQEVKAILMRKNVAVSLPKEQKPRRSASYRQHAMAAGLKDSQLAQSSGDGATGALVKTGLHTTKASSSNMR